MVRRGCGRLGVRARLARTGGWNKGEVCQVGLGCQWVGVATCNGQGGSTDRWGLGEESESERAGEGVGADRAGPPGRKRGRAGTRQCRELGLMGQKAEQREVASCFSFLFLF